MEYFTHPASMRIEFLVNATDRDLIDKLAFVHLIAMKFDGDVYQANSIRSGKKKHFHFNLRFPSWEVCSSAKAHCDRNLFRNGSIVDDYKGALDAADPGRTMASILKERAECSSDDA